METGKKYFIIYSGDHIGKLYVNEIIAVADTLYKSIAMLNELISEDNEVYGEPTDPVYDYTRRKTIIHGEVYNVIATYKPIWYDGESITSSYRYEIIEKECYIG